MNIVVDSIPPADVGKPQGRVRRMTQKANTVVRNQLKLMRNAVAAAGGKANLDTALGVDSAELQIAYDAMKVLAEVLDSTDVVPAIE